MVISMDFDGTLTEGFIQDLFHYYRRWGHKVIIVTSSGGENEKVIKKLLEKLHAEDTPIYYTDGNLKAETLRSLGVYLHFDNMLEEVMAANELGINAVLVNPFLGEDNNIINRSSLCQ